MPDPLDRVRSAAAARGLDIDHLTHVVNFNLPSAVESYVHRVGRVGRSGREGVAITLIEPREHRMLKAVERATGTKIAVETLPTAADLRARRLELTAAALRETLLAGELDGVRAVVESLSDEFDIVDVALAAVKLAHEATGVDVDEAEIPEPAPPRERTGRDRGPRSDRERGREFGRDSGRDSGRDGGRDRKPFSEKGKRADRHDRQDRPERNGRAGRHEPVTRLFVGAGRIAGIRPADLVGAIANETRLSGKDVGSIEITDRFSIVEVPSDAVHEVLGALRETRVKGRKVTVRRDRAGR